MFPPPSGTAADEDPATQTERRFDLVRLEPFRYDTADNIAAWTAHLAGIEQNLRLFAARAAPVPTGGRRPDPTGRGTPRLPARF